MSDSTVAYTDPFGLCPIPPSSCLGRQGADVGVGFVPGASTLHDAATALTGRNHITREEVGTGGRLIAAAGAITPVSGGQLRGIGKIIGGIAERYGEPIVRVLKSGVTQLEHQVDNVTKMIIRGPETHPIKPGGDPVTHYNVEVHESVGNGRFSKTENTHLDENGRVIP